MIEDSESFGVKYYEYAQPFYGSYKGLRYRIARDPMDFVALKRPEEKGEAEFLVTVWWEPYSYQATPDSEKKSKKFPFDEEGKKSVTGWLNEMWQQGRKQSKLEGDIHE